MYTKNELINEMWGQITDIINEHSDFTKNFEDVSESVNNEIFQMIDNSEYVIYTNKAKEISKTIDLYDAFDTSDISGERFEDWSQVAFENLYAMIYNNIDVDGLIKTTLDFKKKYCDQFEN